MVKYINYKGKKLPFRASIYATKMLMSIRGEDKMKSKNSLDEIENLEIMLKYGLIAGHHYINEEYNIDDSELPFILDVCHNEILEHVIYFKTPKDKIKEDTKKKI